MPLYQKHTRIFALFALSTSFAAPMTGQIRVGQPRVYDERALRKKLAALEEQLRAVNAIDASKLDTTRIQGARQSGFSLSLSATTLPMPGIKETSSNTTNAGTINTTVGDETTVSVDSEKPSVTTTRSTKPTVQDTGSSVATSGREVTTPSVTPTPPAVVVPSASLPAGGPAFGLSASDILDAQVNLSYQIINTRLALEGAVTDRLRTFGIKDGKPFRYTALSTVLGIPISIDEECKDCVAEIDVTIVSKPLPKLEATGKTRPTTYNTPAQQVGQPPVEVAIEERDTRVRLVSLLPREKVYNVATVSEKNIAVGAAALVSVVNIGGSGLWSRKRAYLIKDIDTIARDLTGKATAKDKQKETSEDSTGTSPVPTESPNAQFGWQFRPVLGRRTVEGRLREVLVVLSLPISDVGSETWEGIATVQTRWRRYDSKNGIAGALIREYASSSYPVEVFPNALLDSSLGPKISRVSVEEGSNGRFGVAVYGTNFDDALSVQAGDARVDAKSGLIVDSNRISFVVDASVLAGSGVSLIGRYGSTTAVTVNDPKNESSVTGLRILNATIVPIERDLLSVTLHSTAQESEREPNLFGRNPLVLAGGHVFGTRTSPLTDLGVKGSTHDYQFRIAAAELRDNPLITIRLPLQADVLELRAENGGKGEPAKRYWHTYRALIPNDFTADAPILVSVDETARRYAITGSGFVDGMKPQLDAPGCSRAKAAYKTPQLLVLELSPECAVAAKYLILSHPKNDASQALLKLPGGAALPPKVTGQQDAVKVGDIKTFTLNGVRLDKVFEVRFNDKPLSIDKDSDDKKLLVRATEDLTKTEGEKELWLYCTSGEVLKPLLKVSK